MNAEILNDESIDLSALPYLSRVFLMNNKKDEDFSIQIKDSGLTRNRNRQFTAAVRTS